MYFLESHISCTSPVAWLLAPVLDTVSAATPTRLARNPTILMQTCTFEVFSRMLMVFGVRFISGAVLEEIMLRENISADDD